MASMVKTVFWIIAISGIETGLADDCLYYEYESHYDADTGSYTSSYTKKYKECDDGCCGTTSYRYCCFDYDSDLSGGAIAGIVIGCLVGIGALCSILICVFCKFRAKHLEGRVFVRYNINGRVQYHDATAAAQNGMQVVPPVAHQVQSPYLNQGQGQVITQNATAPPVINSYSAPPPSYEDTAGYTPPAEKY